MLLQNFRRTKIIATLGPASNTKEKIKELVKVGVNVFRLNFSHGTHAIHKKTSELIREVSKELQQPIGILVDLQGPKIRVGKVQDEGVQLVEGENLIITTEDILGGPGRVPTTYKDLPKDVHYGDLILLDDGLRELRVEAVDGNEISCKVIVGGLLTSNKGINLPGAKLSTPALTEKDEKDVNFLTEMDADFLALSFVRSASDIHLLKSKLQKLNIKLPIIAKIEKPQAVENEVLDEIIDSADGIMVARGDLGVEMKVEMVPRIQKDIVYRCNSIGKPVIIATQMLDSMIQNPRPTRAETSDVANAVADGADAVMLSAESASGKYPVQSVKTMVSIIREMESWYLTPENNLKMSESYSVTGVAQGVCRSAINMARTLGAKAIISITYSGNTAQQLSRFKTAVPIIAITKSTKVQRKLCLVGGVTSVLVAEMNDIEECLKHLKDHIHSLPSLKEGDTLIVTSGMPIVAQHSTNMVTVQHVKKS